MMAMFFSANDINNFLQLKDKTNNSGFFENFLYIIVLYIHQ
jgi:hypothetical protein